MELRIWQVDAFAEKVFEGNPAAVIPLAAWLSDEQMQSIAAENNLSETAFVALHAGEGSAAAPWPLRWFTPTSEVDLCGHATLATAWVLFREGLARGAAGPRTAGPSVVDVRGRAFAALGSFSSGRRDPTKRLPA